jgi:hypothetical protein
MRYATVQRRRLENFIVHDLHDAASSTDYFVWFLRSGDETILVDTGFSEAAARERKRTFLRCPIDSLQAAGIHLEDIRETGDHACALRPCGQYAQIAQDFISFSRARDGLCHRQGDASPVHAQ